METESQDRSTTALQAGGFSSPETTPVGGLLDTAEAVRPTSGANNSTTTSSRDHERAAMVSPVSTMLDTYLDNIMANVTQLALCL